MENILCYARPAQWLGQSGQSNPFRLITVLVGGLSHSRPFSLLLLLFLSSMVSYQGIAQCPPTYTLSATVPSVNATTGTYTVPAGGPYKIRITAKGARGGNSYYYSGGNGATMQGEFIVSSGQVLSIVAGAPGNNTTFLPGGGGGGGGTGVRINDVSLIIAGGGGGGGYGGPATQGQGGTVGNTGTGGGAAGTFSYSGGGGGLIGAGGACPSPNCGGGGTAGFSGTGGIAGLSSTYGFGGGGVGGGGGGGGEIIGGNGGGGGGGYSGGNGGVNNNGGGGGGSYNTGSNQVNTAGSNNGGGEVVIECLGTACPFVNIAYVNAAVAVSGDGTSWATAFKTLQEALTAARTCTGITQIWVAKGNYYPDEGGSFANNDRTAAFTMKNGLAIYGGFGGNEASNYDLALRNFITNETILSGDLAQNDGPNFANNAENSYHIFVNSDLSTTAVLDGVTLSGGNDNSGVTNAGGGAIFNTNSNITISKLLVTNNWAANGGGIYNRFSSVIASNCRFISNQSNGPAAVINIVGLNSEFTNCVFSDNVTGSFATLTNYLSGATVSHCTFTGNTGNDGGAIYNQPNGRTVTIDNCQFTNNTAAQGAGVRNFDGNIFISNSRFADNAASGNGGAISDLAASTYAANCVFIGNTSATNGGAVYTSNRFIARNSSFAGNQAPVNGAMYLNAGEITNSIVWGNSSGISALFAPSTFFTNSIIQGGCPAIGTCTNVLNIDPLFVSSTNLRLTACSPALDAGDDALNTTTTDPDGNTRKYDAIAGGSLIDMGAYEFQSPAATPVTYYTDADGDHYGTGTGQPFCTNPGAGWATVAGDCNDADAAINPGATEICDDIDNNCDGQVDEGFTNTDGDSEADCVDADDDNDGTPDAEDCEPLDATKWRLGDFYTDADGDGFGTGTAQSICYGATVPTGMSAVGGDCNDADAAINPNATEICDGIDNNCDGMVDEGFTNTDGDSEADCVDADDDNDGTPDATDCAPLDATMWRIGNFYTDADGDGYGTGTAQSICYGAAAPAGFSLLNGDCNDGDASIRPNAIEICGNGIDDNCNGQVDEACGTCPIPQGDWKNNAATWPATALPMMLGTTNAYSKTQLLNLLNASVKGDASLILANQLIAAKLNVANGAAPTQALLDAITAADAAIGSKKLPAKVRSNSSLGNTMTMLAALLEQYNLGLLNTGCAVAPTTITMATKQTISLPYLPTVENFPNPFNTVTSIRYTLPADAQVQLSVYNAQGQKIAILANGKQMAGTHMVRFDGAAKAAGIYLYQLQTEDANGKPVMITGKMVLHK